jgi:hypothetical protein
MIVRNRRLNMAFMKEKVITVTVDDFIDGEALGHVEFVSTIGHQCLVQVISDRECGNPRDDFEHLWTWCTGDRAGYSDVKGETPDDFEDYDGKLLKGFVRDNLIVPLYLYRHSGDSISIGNTHYPFNDQWDAGCMGFAYLSREKIKKEYGWEVLTAKRKQKLIGYLKSEVAEMNAWLEGSVYGVKITDMENEEEDSCWGFICPSYESLISCVYDMLAVWINGDTIRREIAERVAV